MNPQAQADILLGFMLTTAFAELMAGGLLGAVLALVGLMSMGLVTLDPSVPDVEMLIAVYGAIGAVGLVQGVVSLVVAGLVAWGAFSLYKREHLAVVYVALFAGVLFPIGNIVLSMLGCQCALLMMWFPPALISVVSAVLGLTTLSHPEMREEFGFEDRLR